MTDTFDKVKRASIMRAVKSENTSPEIFVRRTFHAMGFRFRLHVKNLAGRPDLAFPRFKTVVFVNGCFWHWHGCPRTRLPSTNVKYWKSKISRNVKRDQKNYRKLRKEGWRVFIIWECKLDSGINRIASYLLSAR